MDISTLTTDELQALITAASERLHALAVEHAQDVETRKGDISGAITALEALLGPEGAQPGTNSIREVLAYDDTTIEANAGLAFRLILQGMESLTSTVLDVARVVGD